jgi:hypothetical protein
MDPVTAGGASPAISAERNSIGPGFFEIVGTPPLAGREFTPDDARSGRSMAIINQPLADRLWPGQSAVGRTVFMGDAEQPAEIVGVVPNAFYHGFRREPRPNVVFLPESQRPEAPGRMTFYVRHTTAVDIVAPAVRASLRDFDSRIPIESMTAMDAALEETTAPVRMTTSLLMLFAIGSTIIAAIGLYGVVAFDMRRRTREFGVRLAIGASARQVLGSILREAATLTVVGLGIGVLLSVAAATLASGLLFGITPTDPGTYAAVFALLSLVSLTASGIPAWRASRIDPVLALRQE